MAPVATSRQMLNLSHQQFNQHADQYFTSTVSPSATLPSHSTSMREQLICTDLCSINTNGMEFDDLSALYNLKDYIFLNEDTPVPLPIDVRALPMDPRLKPSLSSVTASDDFVFKVPFPPSQRAAIAKAPVKTIKRVQRQSVMISNNSHPYVSLTKQNDIEPVKLCTENSSVTTKALRSLRHTRKPKIPNNNFQQQPIKNVTPIATCIKQQPITSPINAQQGSSSLQNCSKEVFCKENNLMPRNQTLVNNEMTKRKAVKSMHYLKFMEKLVQERICRLVKVSKALKIISTLEIPEVVKVPENLLTAKTASGAKL